MKKLSKYGVLVAAMFLLSTMVFPVMAGVPTEPKPDADAMWIEPGYIKFYTNTTEPCHKFNITVWLNVTSDNFFIYQVKLLYDSSWLNATRAGFAEPPTSQFCEGHTTVATGPDLSTAGEVFFGETLLGTDVIAPPRVGSLVWIEFHILKAPPKGGSISSAFDITTTYPADTWVWNPDGDLIPTTQYNGLVEYDWAVPPKPYLAVQPNYVEFPEYVEAVCQCFNIGVYIMNLSAAWYLTNASICLCYNTTLIETETANVTIDPLWATSTVDVYDNLPLMDNVTIFVGDPTATPSGDVLIANITFHVKYQGTSPEVNESPLELCEYTLMDHEIEIPTLAPVNGRVKIKGYRALITDLNGDGKVNMEDLYIAARAFGSYGPDYRYPGSPPHSRWNPDADITRDNKVDMRDIVLIARDFGKGA